MERQKIDSNLQNNEEKLKAVLNATHDRIVIFDRQLRQLEWHAPTSDKLSSDILYEERRWNLGKSPSEVIGSEKARIHEEAVRKALAGETVTYEWSWGAQEDFSPHDPASAAWFSLKGVLWFYTRVTPLKDHQNRVIGAVSATREVTELRQTTQSAQASEAKFRSLVSSMDDMVVTMDYDMYVTGIYGNRNLVAPLDAEEFLGRSFWNIIGPETAALHEEACQSARRGETIIYEWIGTSFEPPRNVQTSVSPLKNDTGQVTGLISLSRDVTVLKQAEEAKKHLEVQLLQSQKMEALGRLAGGLAHDFNNLLAIIQGYAEMTLMRINVTNPCYDPMKAIHEAGIRAADLTQQFLAFSRKQILQPKVLNLNALISELGRMLKRLIGEHIDLQLRLGQNLGRVKIDPGQIEQVLLNLSLNARDAMPRTGKLVIETSIVDLGEEYVRSHPGAMAEPHVRITVSDTGEGMNPETMEHIFEPFFTTKDVGKGTGLGLSTVYGIVTQSGGHIQVASQLGEGTTFIIDLPRIQGTPEKDKPVPIQPIGVRHRKETLMLVEDEPILRKMMAESLRLMGYTVLEAGTPNEALVLSEQQKTIGLILTDVIMPQMSGPELVQKLSEIRPEAKVLYMSGYTDNPILVNEVVEKKRPFIQKPFPIAALSAKIRQVLDNAGGGAR